MEIVIQDTHKLGGVIQEVIWDTHKLGKVIVICDKSQVIWDTHKLGKVIVICDKSHTKCQTPGKTCLNNFSCMNRMVFNRIYPFILAITYRIFS